MALSFRPILGIALQTTSASAAVVADPALRRTGTPSVSFTAVGPGGLKIVGTTSDLDVSESAGTMTARVPLTNLDTGMSLRNRHMKEKYLEVTRYPNAELAVLRASLKVPDVGGEASGEAPATMSLHGQQKPVRFTYHVTHKGAGNHVTGAVHLEMPDYGISVASYLGVSVKPGVDVTVTFDTLD